MIRVSYNGGRGYADVVLSAAADAIDASRDHDFETAVLLSLYTDRRVEASEVPDGVDRGGWWGASFPKVDGDIEGSRFWLLFAYGGSANEENRRRSEEYATEALSWMIEDSIAEEIEPTAFIVASDLIEVSIRFKLSTGQTVFIQAEVPIAV